MNRKARATIEQYGMLGQGDSVTVAVSGGADSVALLDFLCAQLDLRLTIRACHLNHRLRGAESDRDEQLVRTMCAEYGVPLTVCAADVKALAIERGDSLEQVGRAERYRLFAQMQEQYGGRVATAHTLSDTAETVLFHLARGTGAAGLCGIPPVRGFYIRPLIGCSRNEVEAYCRVHGIPFVVDSSNLSCEFTRNHIRQNILPQLDRVNGDALAAIGRMTGHLRLDQDYLNEQARAAAETLTREGGLEVAGLRALHPALRARVLARLLEQGGIERSAERLALCEGLLERGGKRVLQVGRQDYLAVRAGILRLERRVPRPKQPTRACPKRSLDGLRLSLECEKTVEFAVINCAEYEIFENNVQMGLKNVVDYDKIRNDVFLRARAPGDRIRPVGRGCSKPLRKLMNELALPEREQLLVLADSDGVFFCEGIGPDERVAVCEKTKNLLTIVFGGRMTEGCGCGE